MKPQERLKSMNACSDAVAWAVAGGYKTFRDAWAGCSRGDWMLWYAGRLCKTTTARKRLVLAVCDCARPALKFVKKGELRPLKLIETTEAWVCGKATIEQVRAAAAAVRYATDDDAAAAAANCATAAAIYAAAAVVYDPDAAYAASCAATYAAFAAAARIETLAKCADIVRQHYPTPPANRGAHPGSRCGKADVHVGAPAVPAGTAEKEEVAQWTAP